MLCKNICFACCASLSMTLGAMNNGHSPFIQLNPLVTTPTPILYGTPMGPQQPKNAHQMLSNMTAWQIEHPSIGSNGPINTHALAAHLNQAGVSDAEYERRMNEAQAYNKSLSPKRRW